MVVTSFMILKIMDILKKCDNDQLNGLLGGDDYSTLLLSILNRSAKPQHHSRWAGSCVDGEDTGKA